jgi:hypothetical protein
MLSMKRPFLLVAAGIAALTLLALPAAAGNDHNVRGPITGLTSTTISVQAKSGIVTTCSLGKHSPAVTGYATGDTVQMVCHGSGKGRAHAKLARIKHLTLPAAAPSADTSQVTFGGAITSLDGTSISLHDGDRDLTCALDSSSPSTDGFKVGQHVKAVCAGGTLVAISAIGTADAGRAYTGSIASIDDGGVTVTTDHGPVTCTLGSGSPAVGGYQVGDHVLIGCNAKTMQLVFIKKMDGGDGGTTTTTTTTTSSTPAPPTTHTKTVARGSVSALTDGSISVQTDGGTVSCTLDSESPSLDGYAVGDNVTIGCLDGVLRGVEKH